MNAIIVKGRVNLVRGGFTTRLSRMTGNRAGRVRGKLRQLVGRAQVLYGRAKGTTRRLIG